MTDTLPTTLPAILREAELFRAAEVVPVAELREWYESRVSELNLPVLEYEEAIRRLYDVIEGRGDDAP
jgi:hypothetical protein